MKSWRDEVFVSFISSSYILDHILINTSIPLYLALDFYANMENVI